MSDVRVQLYLWSLTGAKDHARYDTYLSPDEAARKDRFVYARDRDAYLNARGRLREILAAACGIAPADVVFTYNPQGKPAVDGGPSFNLSHSGGIACLALHDTLPLGVDIEAHRMVERDVARRFFSATEYATLTALPEAAQEAGFFRCWTRKEAIVKALGGGLSIPLDAFDVSLDARRAELLRMNTAYGQADAWTLQHFSLGPDMPGALAIKTRQSVKLDIVSTAHGMTAEI